MASTKAKAKKRKVVRGKRFRRKNFKALTFLQPNTSSTSNYDLAANDSRELRKETITKAVRVKKLEYNSTFEWLVPSQFEKAIPMYHRKDRKAKRTLHQETAVKTSENVDQAGEKMITSQVERRRNRCDQTITGCNGIGEDVNLQSKPKRMMPKRKINMSDCAEESQKHNCSSYINRHNEINGLKEFYTTIKRQRVADRYVDKMNNGELNTVVTVDDVVSPISEALTICLTDQYLIDARLSPVDAIITRHRSKSRSVSPVDQFQFTFGTYLHEENDNLQIESDGCLAPDSPFTDYELSNLQRRLKRKRLNLAQHDDLTERTDKVLLPPKELQCGIPFIDGFGKHRRTAVADNAVIQQTVEGDDNQTFDSTMSDDKIWSKFYRRRR